MAEAMCGQAKSLLASRQISEARDLYTSATARDSGNARAWNGLGVADDMLGKRDEAKVAYQQASSLAPTDINIVNNLAHLSLETGDYEDAIGLLEPLIRDGGATTVMRQNLAEAYGAVGRQSDAEALLRIDLPPAQVSERLASYKKLQQEHDSYADLGSYPTEGMAQAHIEEIKEIAGTDASTWTFAVIPDVKVIGGIPVFTIRISGESPATICALMNTQALPCIPYGK